ncbi:MAG TPA: 23S rRNA (adenine(2503)-C(2))-methyltransferase RlmN [Planctomycetota bacterium]|nr:23S rRNA (adenine(2503)-C(2))-methyltransferase RlmN [Planctomycetota bacterium]
MPLLHALTRSELERFFGEHGLNVHQSCVTFEALHRGGARVPSEIEGVSMACRRVLERIAPLPVLEVDSIHRASDGTLKLRLRTQDARSIEAVIIPAPRRVTLCVSSQVGCAAGCSFCHTATMGLLRNLEAWEIIEQHRVGREVWARERRGDAPPEITNIVFMGMGEPLHNEASVEQACRILGDGAGVGFSPRHLVVSTAGVGARIRPFWELNVGALALSLHSTRDDVREKLVPLNRLCSVAELRRILLGIPWRNRESVTIAYLLLDGVNDSREDARRLANWIEGIPAKVNLLEFNPYPGSHFTRTSPEQLRAFRGWLREFGVFNTLRRSRGEDALAACGQLAARE